jgi:hypothetical protein
MLTFPSFWTAASLADILRRFKNIGKPITEFPDCMYHGAFFTPYSSFHRRRHPT